MKDTENRIILSEQAPPQRILTDEAAIYCDSQYHELRGMKNDEIGLPEAFGYNWRRRHEFGLVVGGTGIFTDAMASSSSGTQTNSDDSTSAKRTMTTGAVSGNIASISFATNYVRRAWEPEFWIDLITGGTITNYSIFVGFRSDAASVTPVLANLKSASAIGMRFSTVDSHSNWQGITSNANGSTITDVDTAVALQASTAYKLYFRVVGSTAYFYVNGLLVGSTSSTFPASSTTMKPIIMVSTHTGSTRSLDWRRKFTWAHAG